MEIEHGRDWKIRQIITFIKKEKKLKYNDIVIHVMASYDLTNRTAQEYIKVALYYIGKSKENLK